MFFEIDRSFDSKSFKRFHSTISRICAGKNNSYLGYKFIFFYGDIDLNINLKFDKEYSDANKVRKNFLNETIVSEMRNFYLDLKYNQRELSKMYNVNISTVNSLLRNNIYIDKNYNPDLLLIKKELNNQKGEKNNASKYSELDINNIRKLILEGKGVTEISKTLNIPIGTISNIKYKTQWKHVE